MHKLRRSTGWWLVAGVLFVMQTGGQAEGRKVVSGPSQGAIPPAFTLTAAGEGGGGGEAGSPSPPAGTDDSAREVDSRDDTVRNGPWRLAPGLSRTSPIDSRARDPYAGGPAEGGGGGGGGGLPSNVVPVLRGNPTGPDSIYEAPPSPAAGGGGGGGGMPADWSPFIRVLPGGDAADWARSPSPGPSP